MTARRSVRRRDAGMVTAETAVLLPVLVVVLAAAVFVLACVAAQLKCVDAARSAARRAARGEPAATVTRTAERLAPSDATVSIGAGSGLGDTATVEVVVQARVRPFGGALRVVPAVRVSARQQAASAADLSALAAAAALLQGPEVACDRARALATEVGAVLSSCQVDGDRVDVVAQVRPSGPLGRFGTASVRAAAGPVPAPAG